MYLRGNTQGRWLTGRKDMRKRKGKFSEEMKF
jgi:hypothetical protein